MTTLRNFNQLTGHRMFTARTMASQLAKQKRTEATIAKAVPSYAHFTPYTPELAYENPNLNSGNNCMSTDYRNINDDNEFTEWNPNEVVQILSNMQEEPIAALSFFNRLKEKGSKHYIGSYLAIIKILCHWGMGRKLVSIFIEVINSQKEHMHFHVSDLLETMADVLKAEGPNTLVHGFDAAIKGYVTLGMFEEAIDTIFEIKNNGVGPCLVSCNFLMNRLVGHGKFDKAVVSERELKEAEEVLRNMEEHGIFPNEVNYFNLIQGYCDSGNIIKALAFHNEMAAKGEVPHQTMYGKLIAALCRAGEMKWARWAFDDMIYRGLSPDIITYTIMLKGYCHVNYGDEARALFLDMKNKGIIPDVVTYTVLLDGICKIVSKKARSQNDFEGKTKVKKV